MHQTRNSNGFTLIELMIVVVIIGILAALAIPQFQAAAMNNKVDASLGWIQQAEEAYMAEYGVYVADLDSLDVSDHLVAGVEYSIKLNPMLQKVWQADGSGSYGPYEISASYLGFRGRVRATMDRTGTITRVYPGPPAVK